MGNSPPFVTLQWESPVETLGAARAHPKEVGTNARPNPFEVGLCASSQPRSLNALLPLKPRLPGFNNSNPASFSGAFFLFAGLFWAAASGASRFPAILPQLQWGIIALTF